MDGFFEMGGYAIYVWSSYGITALVLAALAFLSLRANASAKAEVERIRPKRTKRSKREHPAPATELPETP